MVRDPVLAPRLRWRDAPGRRVEMHGAEVDGADGEIGGKIHALRRPVRVAAIRAGRQAEPLVAHRDHVARVEALDILGRRSRPGSHDAGGAAGAARLVGELPGEDGAGAGVARHDGFDVGLVLGSGLWCCFTIRCCR